MKKVLATACLIGSTFALGACATASGELDLEPPYGVERTARYGDDAPAAKTQIAPAEQVFRRAQTK